jgi:DNA polymerase-3 subunit delta'
MTPPAGSATAPPLWAAIRGQDAAVALLQRALATDRVAHAYAFVGPPGVGRRLTALAFARACLCPRQGCGACSVCRRVAAGQHPDCQLVVPTPPKDNPKGPRAIRLEQVRDLEHWAALAPLEAPRKLFVVDDADRLTREAPQALLKTLEEPPPRTLLILIVANVRGLPPTVLSRCQVVRFRPLPEPDAVALLVERGTDPAAAARLARLCRGQVGLALAGELEALQAHRAAALALLATPPPRLAGRLDEARLDRDRDTVAALLETFWLFYRDALCLAAGGEATPLVNEDRREDVTALARRLPVPALADALQVVKEAWLALETNVNPRLALERALLALAPRAA